MGLAFTAAVRPIGSIKIREAGGICLGHIQSVQEKDGPKAVREEKPANAFYGMVRFNR